MRAFAVLAMIAACFDKPSRPAGTNDGPAGFDGPRGDGTTGSMACPGGAQASLFEAFDGSASGSAACGATGGSVTGPANTLVRQGGLLTFTGSFTAITSASCIWPTLPMQSGVILKWALLDSIVSSDTSAMTVTWTQSSMRTTGLMFGRDVGGFDIFLTSNGTTKGMTMADQSHTWWRISPSSTAMAGESSTDGSNWGPAGTDPGVSPIAVAGLEIDFAAVDGNQVKLDAIYLCP